MNYEIKTSKILWFDDIHKINAYLDKTSGTITAMVMSNDSYPVIYAAIEGFHQSVEDKKDV